MVLTYPGSGNAQRRTQTKVEEDRRAAHAMHTRIKGGNGERGAHARKAGHKARAHIITNDNDEDPVALPRTSQKLIAAAVLLRAMPEPATPKGRKLHHEARTLVEDAVRQ